MIAAEARKPAPESHAGTEETVIGRSDPGEVTTPWLTVPEIGRYLHITDDRTIRRMIHKQGLPVTKVGKRYLSCREWIDEWMRRRAERQEEE